MSDPADVLAQYSAPAATGSWDDPQETHKSLLRNILDYTQSLPARAMVNWGNEGQRLQQLGNAGPKEQARDMYGLGHFVDAYDAGKEGRYLPAAGNAALGAMDVAGPVRSKAVSAMDRALQAWGAATEARPAQLTERAAQELQKLMPKSGRGKPGSAAQAKRVGRSEALAERAIPEPVAPQGRSAEEAQRMLEIINRTWPGNVGAGAMVAGGASGIPGTVLNDVKGATLDPLNAMRKEQIEENRAEHERRASPTVEGGQPEVEHYWKQLDQLRHERNTHAGFASGLGLAGGPTMYAAGKSVPWAWSRAMPGALGLAADLAMIHPILGLGAAGLAMAPLAVPAGLGWGSWELAKGTSGQIDQALKKHEQVKALAPIVRRLLENYRADQPNPPSLTPDQAY